MLEINANDYKCVCVLWSAGRVKTGVDLAGMFTRRHDQNDPHVCVDSAFQEHRVMIFV